MKICLVLLALLVAVACGHNKDGGSYSAKKADKLSFKESLIEKIHNIKDKIHAKISSKKATKAAIKAQKHSGLLANLDRGAQPAADCSTVLDDVWEEQCGTKYEPVCRMEMQPHCTSIQAKECAPEAQTRCSFVFEDKCKTISVPKCTIDWEKRCTSTPDCTTIEAKSCTEVEKDVCVTHMDKTCTTSTVNVCRKGAVRELTTVVDTVERTGLKASIKAKAAAHKALKGNLVSSGRLHKRDAKEFDEDELEAELNELEMEGDMEEQEKLEAELLDVGVADQLPETPREEPAAAVEKPQEALVNETVSQGTHGIQKRSDNNTDEGFVCDGGIHKIPISYFCDGTRDCKDGSDEEKCEGVQQFFTCQKWDAIDPEYPEEPNKIRKEQKCDGDHHCKDWSDEDPNSCPEERLRDRYKKINAKEYNQKLSLFNARCKTALGQKGECEADNMAKINQYRDMKTVNDLKLTEQESNMRAEDIAEIRERKDSKWFIHQENDCYVNVLQGRGCDNDPISQLHFRQFMKDKSDYDLKFYIDAFNYAQDEKARLGLIPWERIDHIRAKRAVGDSSEAGQLNQEAYEAAEEASAEPREAVEAPSRSSRSLKGDTSADQTTYLAAKSFHASKGDKEQIAAKKADFKGQLETFKAGYKVAKDQYHEAKAQFKATTKALIHAKFNKGPKARKGDKGHHVKAAVPTIRVKYVKTCQDEPRKICSQTPRQECHKEVVPLCKVEPRETCVQKEKCKSWPKKNCGMVHKETCLPFPTKKCTETSTPVCRIVPRQECTEKKHEICETVPTKDCQKVLVSKPRTVCIPKPTTRTIEDW